MIKLKLLNYKECPEVFANINHDYVWKGVHKRSFSIELNKEEFLDLRNQMNNVQVK